MSNNLLPKLLHKFKNKRSVKESALLEFINSSPNNRYKEWEMEEKYYWNDRTTITPFDAHYIYHPAWATRILNKTKPATHIDISSTLHFCSMLSAFMPVEFYDYRPASLTLSQLHCGKADLNNLHFSTNSVHSISCMHTIEHIGLGRYGDQLDPDGDLKAINELIRVLAPAGDLLFVVPVGHPKLVFHAHRIYSYDMIMEYFSTLHLKNFALIKDDNSYTDNANPNDVAPQQYACGCFWFQKPSNDHQ
jgi:SAM-dependent methyltransferase